MSSLVPSSTEPMYVQLSKILAVRIEQGEWSKGRIPTVREIAEQYGVSSFTAFRAVGLLQNNGLVVSRDRSGSFARPANPQTAAATWGVVLRVSPGSAHTASEAVSRAGFEIAAGEGAAQFMSVPFPFDERNGEGADQVVRALTAAGASGVIFLPSRVSDEAAKQDEKFLDGCRQSGLPVVLIDRNLRGATRPLEYDLVASDHLEGGRACTRHLLDLGRRSIACVIASPTSSHADRRAGYLDAIGSYGQEDAASRVPLVLTIPPGLATGAEYGWLADRLLERRADGVICYQDYTAVGLILELLRRGVAVPRDVAVVGCDDLPIGSTFSLGVTTYSYPSAEIVRRAVRMMQNRIANPAAPPVKILVPGALVVRNSTDPQA